MLALALTACGPRPRPPSSASAAAAALLPDVRLASGRPPVVLVARDGDPAAAIALAVTTAGGSKGDAVSDSDEPAAATAVAAVLEGRLRGRFPASEAVVTPSWDGVRASILVMSDAEATRVAEVLRDLLAQPIGDADVAAARKKLAALGQRPLRAPALRSWARCVGQPHALGERAPKDYGEIDAGRLERWRTSLLGLGRVAVAATGPAAMLEAVAGAVLQGPVWKTAAPLDLAPREREPPVDVFEATAEAAGPLAVHVALDVGSSSAAVALAEALGDPRGPLAARLLEIDLPFRVREVVGTASARGGCVGVLLEAAGPPSSASSSGDRDLGGRVAEAVALVQLEAGVQLTATADRDGRALSRRSGDAREAAELAAWWAISDGLSAAAPLDPRGGAFPARARLRGSTVALALPARRTSSPPPNQATAGPDPSREALAAAIAKATAAWEKPAVEARSRVERGQGEVWVLVASPCGTDGETDADTGLTALATTAAADAGRASSDVRIEPWIVTDGAGIVAHGPALPGESPIAHARRIADAAARTFAAEPIAGPVLARARADLLRRDARNDGPALGVLAAALAPQHPSWVVPTGASEPLARISEAAVLARASALRSGPIRVAVLASTDAAQADAAVRAADRWIARRTSEARSCRAESSAQPPRPGTYAAPPRPGTVPEAYLAFPLPPGDEHAFQTGALVTAALDDGRPGSGAGLLDKAVLTAGANGASLASEASARVIGWPRAPALVVRIVAPQASLDPAVMQTRALLDRLRTGGLPAADLERATVSRTRFALGATLDPRARVVATWRGEPIDGKDARPRVTAEDVRAFVQRHLAEDTMVVVAGRPPRPAGGPTGTTTP